MPPRFAYWTIIAGGLPTAFRATDREELLPTFARLKEKQPDAEMRWFARGKLWASPEEARDQRNRPVRREERADRRLNEREGRGEENREHRGRDWRPGGEHRDPRQQFKDAKKDRNQRFKAEKFARKSGRVEAPRARPHGESLAPERRPRPESSGHRDAATNRKQWSAKPHGEKDGGRRPRPTGPAGDRNSAKPDRRPTDWEKRGPKPQSRGGFGSQRDWSAKPPREKPSGDKVLRPSRPSGDRDRVKPPSGKEGGWRPRTTGEGRPSGPARQQTDWQQRGSKPQSRGGFESQRDWSAKPPREKPSGDKVLRPSRPSGDRDRVKPPSGKEGGWRPRTAGEGRSSGPARQQTDWQQRGPKPQSRGGSPTGWKKDWTAKPPREKSHGDKRAHPARPTDPSDRGGDRGQRNEPRSNQKPRDDARGTFRGEGHGDNSWKPKPPRDERSPTAGERRPFAPRGFQRDHSRGGAGQEPPSPPAPRGPNREPRPSEQPEPSPPPRPSEPVIPPPGPPERGRLNRNKRHR